MVDYVLIRRYSRSFSGHSVFFRTTADSEPKPGGRVLVSVAAMCFGFL